MQTMRQIQQIFTAGLMAIALLATGPALPAAADTGRPDAAGTARAAAGTASRNDGTATWATEAWQIAHGLGLTPAGNPPPDLNGAISPADWNAMVAHFLGTEPGPAGLQQDPRRFFTWEYTAGRGLQPTVGEARDGKDGKEQADQPMVPAAGGTVSREMALAGLVQLLDFYKGMPLPPQPAGARGRWPDAVAANPETIPLLVAAGEMGLVQGYPDGTIRPQQPLTHAEAALLVTRARDRVELAGAARGPAKLPVPPLGDKMNPAPPPAAAAPVVVALGRLAPHPAGSGGGFAVDIHAATYTDRLPGVGTPAGHTPASFYWVLMDVTLRNEMPAGWPARPVRQYFSAGLEDPQQTLFRFEPDWAAANALGSPVADPELRLGPGERVRGLLAFAVPRGTGNLWYHFEGRFAALPSKPHAGGGMRGRLGDLPGPEPVYRYGAMQQVSPYALVLGIADDLNAAASLARSARAKDVMAWVEEIPGTVPGSAAYAVVAGRFSSPDLPTYVQEVQAKGLADAKMEYLAAP